MEEKTLEQRIEDLEAKLIATEASSNIYGDTASRLYVAVRDLQQKVKELETKIASISPT